MYLDKKSTTFNYLYNWSIPILIPSWQYKWGVFDKDISIYLYDEDCGVSCNINFDRGRPNVTVYYIKLSDYLVLRFDRFAESFDYLRDDFSSTVN
mgnify:CR=1 FL=1